MPDRMRSKSANKAFWSAMRSARSRFRKVWIGGRSSEGLRPPSSSSSFKLVLATKVSSVIESSSPKASAP